MEQSNVKPDRRVERGMLVDRQPRQLVAEYLLVLVAAEQSVLPSPFSDGARDTVDQLPERSLSLLCADLAVELLAYHNLGRQL